MIVVEATIWPYGCPPHSGEDSVLRLIIGNDGTGTRDTGNYDVFTFEQHPNARDTWKRVARIQGFPRRPDQGHAAALVARAIEATGAGEYVWERLDG